MGNREGTGRSTHQAAGMASSLEMSRTFKKKDPESYQRIVKRLYCQEVGVDYEESLFVSETPRKDSTGCLSVMMTGRTAGEDREGRGPGAGGRPLHHTRVRQCPQDIPG